MIYRYRAKIRRLEKKIAKRSRGIFLGEPGEYALVQGRRIPWKQFEALYPNHILFFDSDCDDISGTQITSTKSPESQRNTAKMRTDSTKSVQK